VPATKDRRMSSDMTGKDLGSNKMRRLLITYELGENRRYDSFFRRLQCLGALPAMQSQWMLQTPFTVDEIRNDLQRYIDPADRLSVTYAGAMSSRNLINKDRFGTSLA
jgi:hypothetical protein